MSDRHAPHPFSILIDVIKMRRSKMGAAMHRVIIVGRSLFAEALAQMLVNDAATIEIIGIIPTLEAAQPLIASEDPDAVIVTSADPTDTAIFGSLLSLYPDLPIISTHPNTDKIQVITSQRISARSSDLLAAITALPQRRSD